MKSLCFALLLAQNAVEDSAPPAHIQDLLKKRILFQLKQQKPDLQFFFDESTCDVIGSYEYSNETISISSNDKSMQLYFSYTDILAGKKLELDPIQQAIETRANIVAAVHAPVLANALSGERDSRSAGATVKKWLPWVLGAVGLSLGGWAIYNSFDHKGGESAPARRRR